MRALVGRIVYYLGLPVVYLAFKNSTRAYVLLESAGQVLFVRGWVGHQKYKLPGGGLKRGELAVNGAIRELYEETGIKIDTMQVHQLSSTSEKHAGAKYHHIVFKADLSEQVWPKISKLEIMEAVWLNPTQINLDNSDQLTTTALKSAGFELL